MRGPDTKIRGRKASLTLCVCLTNTIIWQVIYQQESIEVIIRKCMQITDLMRLWDVTGNIYANVLLASLCIFSM